MDELVRALFDELRNRIDAIDRNMVHLVEERMQVVTRISELKAKHGIAVLDAEREKNVLQNIRRSVQDDAFEAYILQVFEGIMAASRGYQQQRISAAAALAAAVHPARYGLIGAKLGHSRSPEIHDIWFRRHGINGTYDLLEKNPDELAGLLPELKAHGFRGINVTIPYKSHIMRHLEEISPEALRIGAVNTIAIGEKMIGYNTDYAGFGRLVESILPGKCVRKAAVLGTGGSSHAVITWLEDQGAEEITLVSRDPDEASLKWPGLHAVGYEDFSASGCDLLVNTTPVGMFLHLDASPLQARQLEGAGCVIDLIYNPLETRLMQEASRMGIPCANGLLMLVAQALGAQAIWQGIPYDPADAEAILGKMSVVEAAG